MSFPKRLSRMKVSVKVMSGLYSLVVSPQGLLITLFAFSRPTASEYPGIIAVLRRLWRRRAMVTGNMLQEERNGV